LRGPKKKKGGPAGPAEVVSEDVVNIFKERTDPVKKRQEYLLLALATDAFFKQYDRI